MDYLEQIGIEFGNAICYSGYREGQSPVNNTFPSYDQVVEDLKILEEQWKYLRIYDSSEHADLVLEAIRKENLNFKVMLGSDLAAESNNSECPWGGRHSKSVLADNIISNDEQIDRMIVLANEYSEIVFSVSIGNEASVEWSDHQVSVQRLISFVRRIKKTVKQPVTFCENYVPWIGKLEPLVVELDFISVHTYPVWEYKTIEDAMKYTKHNYKTVAKHYPNKPVVVTEAGWTTKSNGRGIEPWNASQELQAEYYSQLMNWSQKKKILTFVFEAFDEPWKGSEDLLEPEKHWGVFTVDRKPKAVMEGLYSHL
ncbi:MAG: exo-beta-1,3-glucanase (GH17 family) [Cocleimonas sp.]|jgi:exo-beta-1,3-glucanase (GH17 family)